MYWINKSAFKTKNMHLTSYDQEHVQMEIITERAITFNIQSCFVYIRFGTNLLLYSAVDRTVDST